eukprot:scaffold14789_cov150-Amphora_coffeaeformis.AAC.2
MESFDFPDDSVVDNDDEDIQLYRSKASCQVALELLEYEGLTPDDIVHFCQTGEGQSTAWLENENSSQLQDQLVYRRRRQEIQRLLAHVKTGRARWDDDGRLVEVHDPTAPPAIPLPPPPAVAVQQGPLLNNNLNGWLEQEEEDREWMAQGERQAAAAVERVRQRWHNENNNDDNNDNIIQLVHIPPDDDQANLTFRRVCYAVLAVVGCFTAIMFQTLPLSSPSSYSNPDKLLGELLYIKPIEQHMLVCPGLERTENKVTTSKSKWGDYNTFWGGQPQQLTDDCADGVLHIPSTRVLLKKMMSTRSIPAEFALNGVNVSWFMDCHSVDNNGETRSLAALFSNNSTTTNDDDDGDPPDTCNSNSQHQGQCFRGIHDEFISGTEINKALDLGAKLILKGGDHHDIYLSDVMPPSLESIVAKIRVLLAEVYSVQRDIQPVAFRIGAEGPMDGTDVPRLGLQSVGPRPVKLLNLTNYVQYVERVGKRNGFAQFSLPWPLRVQPYRDECNLLADMQVDSRFSIHTMIFLADGAGSEFRGGEALYVDDHPSNANPRKKIRRGLVVDGTRGRVVVSTGGLENRRCRLPIRAGVRAALQIWWQ